MRDVSPSSGTTPQACASLQASVFNPYMYAYREKALTAPEVSCWASLWVMRVSERERTSLGGVMGGSRKQW